MPIKKRVSTVTFCLQMVASRYQARSVSGGVRATRINLILASFLLLFFDSVKQGKGCLTEARASASYLWQSAKTLHLLPYHAPSYTDSNVDDNNIALAMEVISHGR